MTTTIERGGIETRSLPSTDHGEQISLNVEVLSGPEKGEIHAITADRPFIVGTSHEASLVLSDDTVSRHHLELVRSGGKVKARDLGSTNGCFHEGAQFTEIELPVGAVLRLGQTELRLLADDERVSLPPSDAVQFGGLLGRSLEMRRVFALLERACQTDATVLIAGETGTGKEVVAESLHRASRRAEGPSLSSTAAQCPLN